MAALSVQADGKVINAGYSEFSSTVEFSMVRFTTSGTLDNTFGSFGRAAAPISGELGCEASAMVLQPDRKILLAGLAVSSSPQEQIALMRFNTNGTVDSTFGTNGAVVSAIGLGASYATAMALQSDGKILAGCAAEIGPVLKFAAARYLTNGVLDASYGVSGVNYFDFGTGANETANGIAVDSLGRLVICGTAGNLFAALRVSGDPILRFTSITAQPNHDVLLTGIGVPGPSQTLLETTNLQAPFSPLAPIIADASGNWEYLDTNAPAFPAGFYRLSYP
jgi:uncharacterized delta-60 repeat protein